MVLHFCGCGRVGHRRFIFEKDPVSKDAGSFVVSADVMWRIYYGRLVKLVPREAGVSCALQIGGEGALLCDAEACAAAESLLPQRICSTEGLML